MQPTLNPHDLEPLHQVVEGVPELREDEQPLVGTVEEALVLHDLPETAQLRLAARAFDRFRLFGKFPELGDLLTDLIGVTGQRVRLQNPLQPLAFGFLQLVELLLIGDVRRRRLQQIVGALEPLLQTSRPVFEGAPHGVGAGGQAPLIQRHQESDRACPRVVAFRGSARALPFHEARDRHVELELGPVDGEVGGVRDAFREHRLGGPRAVVLPLREVDHRLLGAAEVEGGAPVLHRYADRLHVGVGVLVEELQEQGEVLRVALVRGGGQQQ